MHFTIVIQWQKTTSNSKLELPIYITGSVELAIDGFRSSSSQYRLQSQQRQVTSSRRSTYQYCFHCCDNKPEY